MNTMVLTGIHQMVAVQRPQPRITRLDEVLLRIRTVGVCGSDIHYYVHGRIGSQVVAYPFPVGHECAATVEAVGPAVTHLAVGDRVAVDPAVSCGDCDQCRRGREHTCRRLVFMGCPGQIDGCLSDFYVMPAKSCFKLRPDTDWSLAALVEPLSIGVYAVRQAPDLRGKTVLIQGAGPIGLSVLAVARHAGAAAVYVTEPLAYRRAVAAQAGADWTGDPYADGVEAALAVAVPPLFDVVFECCGKQEALDQAVRLLTMGGRLMIVGIPSVDRVAFSVDLMRRHELTLTNVRRQNHCMQPAIDLIESGALDLSWMITHHFDLTDSKAAFDLVAGYADGVVKAMIHCAPDTDT